MTKEQRKDNLSKQENAYRQGLRRRKTDFMQTIAYFVLLFLIIIIYVFFLIGGIIREFSL